ILSPAGKCSRADGALPSKACSTPLFRDSVRSAKKNCLQPVLVFCVVACRQGLLGTLLQAPPFHISRESGGVRPCRAAHTRRRDRGASSRDGDGEAEGGASWVSQHYLPFLLNSLLLGLWITAVFKNKRAIRANAGHTQAGLARSLDCAAQAGLGEGHLSSHGGPSAWRAIAACTHVKAAARPDTPTAT